MRQFLGLTGYYHWFVPGFADLTFPLIELTRMGASDLVQWTESWQVEFVQVKMAMWGAAAHSPDSPPPPFILQTDASMVNSLCYYLLGRSYTLCSDHALLQWLHRMKDANARITWWYLVLQPFKLQLVLLPVSGQEI